MKIGFVTCVQLGLSCIKKIYEINEKLDLLITLSDNKSLKKSGRIFLDDFAKEHDIPLLKINHINDSGVIEVIKNHNLDWLFIIGWSQIASSNLLTTPQKGCIGMHPTLLPQGRGRAAVPWAILKGLSETGVSMFKLEEGVDTGPILGQIKIPIKPNETATTLYRKIELAHEELIEKIYPLIIDNQVTPNPQDESKASYWEGRKPEDGRLDINMTIEDADRLIRAVTRPYPGAYLLQDNKKIIVWAGRVHDSGNIVDNSIQFIDGQYEMTDFEIIDI